MINKTTGSKTDKKRIVSFDLDMTLLDQATWKIPDSAIEVWRCCEKTVLLSSPAAEIWMEWSVWATNNRYGQMQ